jgi:hypothetical protein
MQNAMLLAFVAEASGTQVLATNPIQLVASKQTTLQPNVSREGTSTRHGVSGRLLYDIEGVSGRPVKIYVNDVEKTILYTYGLNGEFSLTGLDLPPVDNQPTTYQIRAVF